MYHCMPILHILLEEYHNLFAFFGNAGTSQYAGLCRCSPSLPTGMLSSDGETNSVYTGLSQLTLRDSNNGKPGQCDQDNTSTWLRHKNENSTEESCFLSHLPPCVMALPFQPDDSQKHGFDVLRRYSKSF